MDGVVVSVLEHISNSMCLSFSALSQIINALSEQSIIQHTWRLIPRVKKAVSLQFAFGSLGSY